MSSERRQLRGALDDAGRQENDAGAWRVVTAEDAACQSVVSEAGPQGSTFGYLELWRAADDDGVYRPIFEKVIERTPRLINRDLMVSLRLRASRPDVRARLVVICESKAGQKFPISATVEFVLDRNWRTEELSLTRFFQQKRDRSIELVHLTIEVGPLAPGTLVELAGARFGDSFALKTTRPAAQAAAAPAETPRSRDDSSYSAANLLRAPILSLSPQGVCGWGPNWKLQAGRGGALATELVQIDVASDIDPSAIQRQPAARIDFRENEHYARLRYPLDLREVVSAPDLALHLWARCVSGAVKLAGYLICALVPTGELSVKIGVSLNLDERWTTIDQSCELDEEMRQKAATAKNCHLVLQFTGVGTVEVYAPWFGSAPRSAPGLPPIWSRHKAFLYDQFIDTAEPVSRSAEAPPCAVIVQCAHGQTPEGAAEELARLLRGRRRSLARTLVLVESTDFDTSSFRQSLNARLSRVIAARVDVETVAAFDSPEATAAIARLTAELAPDTFMLFIESGDQLREDFAATLARSGADIVVFDHDHLDAAGRRERPVLKPGLSSHLLLEHDVVAGAAAFRARAIIAMREPPLVGTPMRRAVLRALWGSNAATVEKIDAILLHRARSSSRDPLSDAAFAREMLDEADRRALVLDRGNRISVRYRLEHEPLVSIIVLFRDKVDFLADLLASIFAVSTYRNYELILVDNQSKEPETYAYLDTLKHDRRIHIVRFDEAFNYSRMNNLGVAEASGEFLIFLNNDMRVLTPDWIETLIGYAALPDSGFVGAKLHYANGRIQHGGVVVALKGLAGHALEGCHDIAATPFLSMHSRDVSAVTGAAMCVERRKLESIGRFDERFIVTGNDVEIALRALAKGYRNIFLGDIQMFHYEKTTRSSISVKGYDIALSLETYEPHLTLGDPCWNRLASLTRSDGSPRCFGEPTGSARKADARAARNAAIMGRKTGPDAAYIARNNLRRTTIDKIITANVEYAHRPDKNVRSIAWLLPKVDHIYRGGVFTAFRLAAAAFHNLGAAPHVVFCSEQTIDRETIREQLAHAFPDVPFVIHCFNPERDNISLLPPTEAAVATLWTTAYILAEYPCRGRFYLVQDYEPLFLAEHAGYGLVETTYQMGLFPICNSPGVGDAIRRYADVPTLVFNPAVDRTIFRPRQTEPAKGSPVQIVFYGRPSNRRNIFSMGIQALLEVKQRFQEAVNIISVGAEFDPQQYGANGQIANAGLLPSLESTAALYRAADIGVVFMQSKHPSYQPLEYMACGCVTVTNRNHANDWLLRDRENCLLTPITLDAIAETISEAVVDSELRRRISRNGVETVSRFAWQPVEQNVAHFLSDPANGQSFAYRLGNGRP